jgi:hypothetical protein
MVDISTTISPGLGTLGNAIQTQTDGLHIRRIGDHGDDHIGVAGDFGRADVRLGG